MFYALQAILFIAMSQMKTQTKKNKNKTKKKQTKTKNKKIDSAYVECSEFSGAYVPTVQVNRFFPFPCPYSTKHE